MGVIAVGIDGSDKSIPALRWAGQEAAAHGHTLRVVTAWSVPVTALSPGGLPAPYPADELLADAKAAQESVIAQAGVPADVEIEHHIVEGGPAAALLEAAEGCDLVVVGTRGHGGFKGLLLGSVSHQVVGHAPCPVVVVPSPSK